MSKELEALQDLSKLVFIYGGVEQYKIIETALKTLEIIKDKIFSNENFEWYDHNDNFTWICLDGNADFTEEEAKLLKEALL